MLKLSQRFGNSHHRFLGELELVRQSALRDFNELTGERGVAVENLSRDKSEFDERLHLSSTDGFVRSA
jgi:hypothetical protein